MLWCYVGLVGLVAVQRLAETALERHEKALFERGAQVRCRSLSGDGCAARYVAFACAAGAVWVVGQPPHPALAISMLVLVVVVFTARGDALVGGAMDRPGDRLPDEPLITTGAFTYVRHPNYVGVVLEIFALPMVFGCWRTAVLYSVANGLLLRHRIAVEEEALGG